MNNSVFNQFIVIIACFGLLTGAAALSPVSSPVKASADQVQVANSGQETCRGAEVWDQTTESCVLKLTQDQVNNLDNVLSGALTDDDLASRIIADENKPRVDPNSPEEVKKRETDFAKKAAVAKSQDSDLISKTLGVSAYVVIPKIKVSAPIVYTTGKDIQTSDWACLGQNCPMRFKLSKGVLHIAGYPEPGSKGNTLIVGHSSAYSSEPGDYKTIFAKINELSPGDTFEVRYSNNKVLKYKVFESFKYELSNAISANPSAEATAASDKRNNRYGDKSVVTLETCWPVGSNKDRWVVQGQLI